MNIPTNFTRVNNLDDFLLSIDKAKKEVKATKKIEVHLQLSIDAPPGPMHDSGHNFSWDRYRENIETLFANLAKHPPLEKTSIAIELHATIDLDSVLKYLGTYEEIKAYLDYFHEFHLYINKMIKKYNLKDYVCQEVGTVFPHIAQPYDISIEESLKLTDIFRMLDYIQNHLDYTFRDGAHIYDDCSFCVGSSSTISANRVCVESGIMGLTIMYDGSICECPCDYILNFEPYWKWLEGNPLKAKVYREDLMKKQFYINPLTATEKEKEDYDWYIYDGNRLNSTTAIHLMMNWGLEMAQSRQIDYRFYKNPEKLLNHLTQFSNDYGCPREQIPAVSNVYMADQNTLRRWFNGATELSQENLKQDLLFEAKGAYKWNIQPDE